MLSQGQLEVRCKRCGKAVDLPARRSPVGARCPRCGFVFRATPGSTEASAGADPQGKRRAAEAPPVTAAEAPLSLRSDLIIEPVEEEGALYYVIKDPVNQRFFRVKALEHFLITQFDGSTSELEIRKRASEAHRVLIAPEVLARFAQKFKELGLLVSAEGDGTVRATTPRPPHLGWLSRILYLKLPLVNPEPILELLYAGCRWAFRPSVVAAMALTIVFATAVLVLNRDDLALDQVLSAEGLLLVYVTVSVVTLLHELAHGLTCRHFGGRVEDMGFLLMYFLPCFYCNVSDAYLFKEKRKRLWVTFAGAYFELFLWALAVLLWRIVTPEAFASRVFLIVIAVGGVKSLLNLNPLIKLDGYYLLVDALGIANLRKEALAGLSRLGRRLLRLESPRARPELASRQILMLRGDRFLVIFGAAAFAYTALVLGSLAFWSGGAVFERFGSQGLGLFTVLLFGLLHRPASVAASSLRSVSKEKWDDLGKKKRRLRTLLLVFGIPVAIGLIPWQLRISSELRVIPFGRATVRAPAEGRIARIHFSEGERVKKGDLLLEYDDQALLLDRETKEAELRKAKEELRLLVKRNPTWQEETRVEQRVLETALSREQAAEQESARAQQLWTLGLLPKDKLDQAVNALERAQSESRKQRAQIDLVSKSSRASRNEQMEVLHLRDPEAQKAVIERLEAEVKRLDDLLGRTRIYAPLAGTLVTYRFQEKMGEYLAEGAAVCDIVDDQKVVIEMPVSEKDIDAIKVGHPVKFKVRGYPGRSFPAQVAQIAPVATPGTGKERTATILLRATVENGDGTLKPDMTGIAKIYCGRTFLANALTRDLVRFIRTEFWL